MNIEQALSQADMMGPLDFETVLARCLRECMAENARLQAELSAKEAVVEAARNRRGSCRRCEGNGQMWADGKAHFATHTGKTVPCNNCIAGEVVDDGELDAAIAAHDKAPAQVNQEGGKPCLCGIHQDCTRGAAGGCAMCKDATKTAADGKQEKI